MRELTDTLSEKKIMQFIQSFQSEFGTGPQVGLTMCVIEDELTKDIIDYTSKFLCDVSPMTKINLLRVMSKYGDKTSKEVFKLPGPEKKTTKKTRKKAPNGKKSKGSGTRKKIRRGSPNSKESSQKQNG